MNSKPTPWQGLLSWMPLLFATLLCLAPRVQAQPTRPMGYWRFENPTPTQEASNNGYNVIFNTNNLTLANANPIVGQYYNVTGVNPTPAVSATLDDASTMTEAVLEFWFRATPGTETGSADWNNKATFYFFEDRLVFEVTTSSAFHSITIDLGGTGVADANYVYDGNWHHIVAQFSACTGEQRVYIDGQSPAGFFLHRPPGGQLGNGGNLHFSGNFNVDRLVGHLDEFAVYDTLLPQWLIYQHYLDGLAGQPYSFPASLAGSLPIMLPPGQSGIHPLDFVPGYPGATPNPADAFDQYPMPRFRPNVAIRRNIPWEANPIPYRQTGLTDSANCVAARHIYERLAHDWNYYLFSGVTHGWLGYIQSLQNTVPIGANDMRHHLLAALNDAQNNGLPRFIISNWNQVHPSHLQAGLPFDPYIQNQNLPDSFFCRDANGNPNLALFPANYKRKNYAMGRNNNNYRLNTIGLDGLTQRVYLDSLMRNINLSYLDLIGENDETQGTYDTTEVLKDAEIALDYGSYLSANSGTNNLVYQADRLQTMRRKYRDPFVAYVDSMNALVGKPPVELYWYDLAGNPTIYQKQRDIVRYNDGRYRPGPYFYPQTPGAWRTGTGINRGVNMTVEASYYQQLYGDSLFIPAISPGFNDFSYIVQDAAMIRPGQFLGLLKGLGGMGGEAFNLFLYHANSTSTNGSWRVWQAPMLSYAQAIFSRAKDFHYHGRVLNGDIAFTYTGTVPSYYTFSSGNSQDFIIVRKLHGQAKYLITASAQRLSNAPGAGDLMRTISFRLHDNNVNILNPITLDARLQGSTYILDLSQPGDTVFHQLDRWHEWKEPSHWCRDFEFDAEVWDSANAALTIRTDQRPGAAVGDYNGFTSFIQFPTTTAQAQYQFQTRGPDQDSLYLWVRARNLGSASANVLARLGTGPQQSLPIAPGNWAWYGRTVGNQPIRFSTLADSVAYLLGIQVSSTQIEIDRVALKRSPADFSNQPFTVSATATASGCIGDSIQFAAGGLQPDGCVDYAWDFGDGGESYVANPAHMYQHPGTHSVVLSVTHGCLGLTLSDTVTVTINAPLVDAGPDRFACLGASIQLAGDTTNASSFSWRPNPALSGGNALHPTITVTNSGYFYLQGTDTLSGCSLTDSVWVTRVSMPALAYPDTVVACPGQVEQLNVTGAFRVDWVPRPTLTVINTTGRADVLPAVSGYYPFMATDACACDTVIDSIFVRIDSSFLINPVVQPIVEFCPGASVQLQGVAGAAHYAWSPATGLSFPGSTTPATVQNPFATVSSNTTYTLTATNALGCVAIGTVAVVQDLTIPNAQIVQPDTTICLGNSITLTGSGVGTFLWTPGNATTASITVSPSAMASYVFAVDDGGACPGSDTIVVSIDSTSLTSPVLADTVEFCPGLPAQLQGVPGMASYTWSPATGLSATNVQSPTATVSSATSYTLTAINALGCVAIDTVALMQDLSIPNAQVVQPDTTICLGNSITLTGSGVGTFLWTPGNATTASITVSPAATASYVFSVDDGGACPGSDTVVVTVDSTSLTSPLLADTVEFCPGLPTQLQGVPGMASYTWVPATFLSATNVQSPTATVSSATSYTLTAINLNGCVATGTVALVQDLTIPTAQVLTPDTLICGTWSVQLQGAGAGSYLWTPSGATTASTTVTPAASTTYTLTVNDGGACVGRDSVRVNLYACCLQTALPYAFLNARASDIVAVFGGNVVNQSISLNGTTLIDVPLTVSGPGTHVYMGDSALIVVQPGDSLVLEDQASIEAGCGEMWMAIALNGPTARLVTRDSATIRDGIDAVRSVGGGDFDIRDSRLLNNRRGIVVLPYAQPHPGRVTGTRFQHSGGLLPPYAGAQAEAGIDIDAVRSIPVGASGASYNRFSGMKVGVDVFNSNTTLQHNHFVLLGDTAAIGIRAAAVAPGYLPSITVGHATLVPGPALDACKNIFEGGKHGVHLDDPGNAFIRGNTFVSSTNTAAFARRTDGDAVVIDHNTFDKNALAVFWGHALNTSGSVSKNQITGDINAVRRGIRFDLLNSSLPAPPDIQVKENVIDLRGAGIWIATSDHINVENNDILVRRATTAPISEQNYGVYLTSNTKVRVVNNQKLRSVGIGNTTINVNGIYVRTSNESVVNCNTLSWLGRHVVFEGQSQPSDFLGNSMMNGVDGFVMVNDGRAGQQGDQSMNQPCDNAWHGTFTNSWTHAVGSNGNLSVFNVRNHLPYLPSNTMNKATGAALAMAPQITSLTNYNPVECYNTLPVYSVKGGVKSVAKQRVPDGDFQQEDQFRIDEWAYATLLADPTLLMDEPELQDFFDDLTATPLSSVIKAQAEMLLTGDTAKAAQYAAQLNLDLPAEGNQRRVLEIRLDGPVIDSAELATLQAIAAQCERAGGKGVNLARGLLATEGVLVWDDPECPASGKAVQPAGADANDVQARCWPNPTDGQLQIDFSEAGQQGRLKVFDALGQLLEERDFDYEDTPIALDGSRWSQGLLLVSVELADGSRYAWRILMRR